MLMRATMTRSSEEMRAWRGGSGEVLLDGSDDDQVVRGGCELGEVMAVRYSLQRAAMARSSEEMRAWSGESGEVLVGEGDDDQDVGGDASWEL